jgi:hypothetical protein
LRPTEVSHARSVLPLSLQDVSFASREPLPVTAELRRSPDRPCTAGARRLDERSVAEALRRLKAGSGTHSPSVAELEHALPGAVRVDAGFLSNPYATDAVMRRLQEIEPRRLERMVSHYPSQGGAIAAVLAPSVGVPPDELVVANGACEVIQMLLAHSSGPLLLCLPTFSAYYEFASGPVVTHRLDPACDFRLDFASSRRSSIATSRTRSSSSTRTTRTAASPPTRSSWSSSRGCTAASGR